jgi:hypothetical protein
MKVAKFKEGDLVFYHDLIEETFAKSDKQLGVVVKVYENVSPLFSHMEGGDKYLDEYLVVWIATGFRSTLLGFNLKKVEIPQGEDR